MISDAQKMGSIAITVITVTFMLLVTLIYFRSRANDTERFIRNCRSQGHTVWFHSNGDIACREPSK